MVLKFFGDGTWQIARNMTFLWLAASAFVIAVVFPSTLTHGGLESVNVFLQTEAAGIEYQGECTIANRTSFDSTTLKRQFCGSCGSYGGMPGCAWLEKHDAEGWCEGDICCRSSGKKGRCTSHGRLLCQVIRYYEAHVQLHARMVHPLANTGQVSTEVYALQLVLCSTSNPNNTRACVDSFGIGDPAVCCLRKGVGNYGACWVPDMARVLGFLVAGIGVLGVLLVIYLVLLGMLLWRAAAKNTPVGSNRVTRVPKKRPVLPAPAVHKV